MKRGPLSFQTLSLTNKDTEIVSERANAFASHEIQQEEPPPAIKSNSLILVITRARGESGNSPLISGTMLEASHFKVVFGLMK